MADIKINSELIDGGNMNGLRVRHVVLSLDCGGLERVVLELVRGGQKLGQEVSVLCLERPGALAREAEAAGAKVECVEKKPGLKPNLVRVLAKSFRTDRPDVIHVHQVGALAYAGPAAYFSGVPAVVHTEHGKHYANRWKTRVLGSLAARFAHRFCCVSEDVLNEVVEQGVAAKAKCVFVPNGIDTGRYATSTRSAELRATLGIPGDALVLGTIGRLSEIKRQDLLLKGFVEVLRELPECRLLIVGDGPERKKLTALAEEFGISERVTFAGYQAQPELYLPLMNVFALTSRSEGLPLAVLEAWSAGKPVIATRVGGLPKLIEHGKTGYLFDLDDAAALAKHIVQLLTNRDLARTLGNAGQAMARDRYDLRVMAQAYETIYRQQLATQARIQPCAS